MTLRLDAARLSPMLYRKFAEFNTAISDSALEPALRHLVTLRASQVNGCAFCVDMHVKEARIHGERELRLHHVAIWHESPLFSPRERAALAWTEALTRLSSPEGIPDEVYDRVRAELPDRELADLTFLVMAINGWNRLCIAFRAVPGSADKAFGLERAGLD